MKGNETSGLRALLAAGWAVLAQQRARVVIAALLASSGVILSAATTNPAFRSEAVVTSLFDDHQETTVVGLDLSGRSRTLSQGLALRVSQPTGGAFPLLLASRRVSDNVLSASYQFQTEGSLRYSDLYEYLGTRDRQAAEVVLKSSVASFRMDPETGATRIRAETASPELSLQVVERYLEALEVTLNDLRETTVRAELVAITEKLARASTELRRNELALRALRDRNRDYVNVHDPAVYLWQLQLEREIRMNETLVAALKSQYEFTMSRLLDRSGRVTIVTPPTLATVCVKPDWPRAFLLASAVAAATVVLYVGTIVGSGLVPRTRRLRWRCLLRTIVNDLRRLPAALRRSVAANGERDAV